jgi:lycopene cyclase domain-containing protein
MSLYLWIDLASVSVPFLFSFHPRIAFHKQWRAIATAIFLASIPFLIWDELFTQAGIWGFSPAYVGATTLGSLPLEEVLFFICVPYSCLFIYWCLCSLTNIALPARYLPAACGALLIIAAGVAFVGYTKWYTLLSSLFAIVVLVATYVTHRPLLVRFIPAYLVSLVPFLVVNGILTGTGITGEVVWYNNAENLGIRLLTIPVEDFLYAFSMLLLNTLLFERVRLVRG